MVGSFLVVIVTGTGALLLPASYQGRAPTPLEAAFTATSATTVTGLGVVDTQTFWTPLGQVVILALIKLGGLGVMTFTSLLGLVILRRLGLTQRLDAAAHLVEALGGERGRLRRDRESEQQQQE